MATAKNTGNTSFSLRGKDGETIILLPGKSADIQREYYEDKAQFIADMKSFGLHITLDKPVAAPKQSASGDK